MLSIRIAGAGVHRRDQDKRSGKDSGFKYPRYADGAVFQWLPQGLKAVAPEFRKLVQKKHALMRQADLSRHRERAAANQSCAGYGVVKGAEWPAADNPVFIEQSPGYRMNLAYFRVSCYLFPRFSSRFIAVLDPGDQVPESG